MEGSTEGPGRAGTSAPGKSPSPAPVEGAPAASCRPFPCATAPPAPGSAFYTFGADRAPPRTTAPSRHRRALRRRTAGSSVAKLAAAAPAEGAPPPPGSPFAAHVWAAPAPPANPFAAPPEVATAAPRPPGAEDPPSRVGVPPPAGDPCPRIVLDLGPAGSEYFLDRLTLLPTGPAPAPATPPLLPPKANAAGAHASMGAGAGAGPGAPAAPRRPCHSRGTQSEGQNLVEALPPDLERQVRQSVVDACSEVFQLVVDFPSCDESYRYMVDRFHVYRISITYHWRPGGEYRYHWGKAMPLTPEGLAGLIDSWALKATTVAADRKADPAAYSDWDEMQEEARWDDDDDDDDGMIRYQCQITAQPVTDRPGYDPRCPQNPRNALKFACPKLPGLKPRPFQAWIQDAWREFAGPLPDRARPFVAGA